MVGLTRRAEERSSSSDGYALGGNVTKLETVTMAPVSAPWSPLHAAVLIEASSASDHFNNSSQ
jgi:hypothetical protein